MAFDDACRTFLRESTFGLHFDDLHGVFTGIGQTVLNPTRWASRLALGEQEPLRAPVDFDEAVDNHPDRRPGSANLHGERLAWRYRQALQAKAVATLRGLGVAPGANEVLLPRQ